jgi:hypothetical protein
MTYQQTNTNMQIFMYIFPEVQDFSLLHSVQTDSKSTQFPIEWVPGTLSPRGKAAGERS